MSTEGLQPLTVAFMHTCNLALTVKKQKIFSVRGLFARDRRKLITEMSFCLCPHIFPFPVHQEQEYHLKCAEPLTDLLIVARWSREKIQEMKSRFLCSQGNTQYMSPLIASLLFPLLGTLSLMHLSSSDLFSLLFQGDMASIKNEKEVQKYLNFCFNIMYFSGHGIFRSDQTVLVPYKRYYNFILSSMTHIVQSGWLSIQTYLQFHYFSASSFIFCFRFFFKP